jgi:tetratricopeptide (TPR) repeat protein
MSQHDSVLALLKQYEQTFSRAERDFLRIFCLFRKSVGTETLDAVFRTPTTLTTLNNTIVELSTEQFEALLAKLTRIGILRRSSNTGAFVMHPLVQSYFSSEAQSMDNADFIALHRLIAWFYEGQGLQVPWNATLEDVEPFIEHVYHMCNAQEYDAAAKYLDKTWLFVRGHGRDIGHKFGAHSTLLEVLKCFFQDGDLAPEQLTSTRWETWLDHHVFRTLIKLGKLRKAKPFAERIVWKAQGSASTYSPRWYDFIDYIGVWGQIRERNREYSFATMVHIDVGVLNYLIDDLRTAKHSLEKAIEVAQKGQQGFVERTALFHYGWVLHLMGEVDKAEGIFLRAKKMAGRVRTALLWGYEFEGCRYASHLQRIGRIHEARQIAAQYVEFSEKAENLSARSLCLRVLADIEAGLRYYKTAEKRYMRAVRLARESGDRTILIEGLLARALFALNQGDKEAAKLDYHEAYDLSVDGCYQLFKLISELGMLQAGYRFPRGHDRDSTLKRLEFEFSSLHYFWGEKEVRRLSNRS